jgi:predicted RNase H-related nuclease YkuK (DUF458 family)
MNKVINVEEVKQYIRSCGPNTKIYFGGDSERFKMNGQWWAEFYTVVVVHINGKNGCKVFGEISKERDYDPKKNKPRMRLMTEVYKISELYLKFDGFLEKYEVEIHLDINPDIKYGSSVVISEAIGYVKGMCNVVPFVKPKSWAASICADRLKSIA